MYVINSSASKFIVGREIIIIKFYNNGNVSLNIGDVGVIVGDSYIDLPDIGLFNIRILDIEFNNNIIHAGEKVIEEYADVV